MRSALGSSWLKLIPEKIRSSLAQEVLQNHPASYALGTRAVANDLRGGVREDILKRIKCPTLVLIGDREHAALDGAIKMHREIKGSSLAVIPNSGHASILERPEISKAAIADFLKEITPPRETRFQ
jgi:pimeloyl-ACP methyl ester carboxylesterase